MGGIGYRYPGLDSSLAHADRSEDPSRPKLLRWPGGSVLLTCSFVEDSSSSGAGSGQFEWHSANLPRLREEYRQLPSVPEPQRSPDPSVEFGDAVDSLVRVLQSRGIKPVLQEQPTLWSADATTSVMADRIPRTLDYFFDDCHFTDKGSRKVSAEILETVASLGRQGRASNP